MFSRLSLHLMLYIHNSTRRRQRQYLKRLLGSLCSLCVLLYYCSRITRSYFVIKNKNNDILWHRFWLMENESAMFLVKTFKGVAKPFEWGKRNEQNWKHQRTFAYSMEIKTNVCVRGVSTRCGLVLLVFTRGTECSIGHIRSSRRHQIATAPKRLPGGTTSASFVRGITTNPRGKWRAHTLHARTCRRPSVSCAVNYVHKFQLKKRKKEKKIALTWMAARATRSRHSENRAESDSEHRLDPNADSECSVSVSRTNRRARRLRCGYSTTTNATNGENLSKGWNFERKPSFSPSFLRTNF